MFSAASALLLFCAAAAEMCRGAHCYDPRPCTGAHCPGARSVRPPRQFSPSTRGKAAQAEGDQARSDQSSTRTQAESFPALHGGHGDGGARRRCGDADCAPATTQSFNETRQCRGIECRLPQSLRAKALGRFCVGDGCPAAPEEESVPRTAGQLPPVHVSDRAAQFLADFPDFGHSSPELGGASLGVQLTCDIKPGLHLICPTLCAIWSMKKIYLYISISAPESRQRLQIWQQMETNGLSTYTHAHAHTELAYIMCELSKLQTALM